MTDKYLNYGEATKVLNVDMLNDALSKGEVKPYRISMEICYSRKELEKFKTSSHRGYTPRDDSLKAGVRKYFEDHEGEWIGLDHLEEQFNTFKASSVRDAARRFVNGIKATSKRNAFPPLPGFSFKEDSTSIIRYVKPVDENAPESPAVDLTEVDSYEDERQWFADRKDDSDFEENKANAKELEEPAKEEGVTFPTAEQFVEKGLEAITRKRFAELVRQNNQIVKYVARQNKILDSVEERSGTVSGRTFQIQECLKDIKERLAQLETAIIQSKGQARKDNYELSVAVDQLNRKWDEFAS